MCSDCFTQDRCGEIQGDDPFETDVPVAMNRRRDLIICVSLAVVTLAAYWGVGSCEYVHFDDGYYVAENPVVQAGLTLKGLVWAFTTNHASNWHPVTWLSHMLDCQLFGLDPGAHHFVNVWFHVANTLLLFALTKRLTGAVWQSAVVAALFAFHPLRVESVAWVAERKDVLSTCFFLLTLHAYVRYVENSGRRLYALTFGLFALGLMAKPMLVTLPFVLLLLDSWPLGRTRWVAAATGAQRNTQTRRLLLEKVPFLLLVAASCALTLWAQQTGGAVSALGNLPAQVRVANAVVSYGRYIWMTIWPADLAVIYPYSVAWEQWQLGGAALLVLGLTVLAFRSARQHPYCAVGWFWYLGTLVPVIGLVQVGRQSVADRYTYIPSIGLYLALVWVVSTAMSHRHPLRTAVATATVVLLAICLALTWRQVGFWKNSETLFRRALSVTQDNALAHSNLAAVLMKQKRLEEATDHFQEAVRLDVEDADAHNNLAVVLALRGKSEEAVAQFYEASRLKPGQADVRMNLGNLLMSLGRTKEAQIQFAAAAQLTPMTLMPTANSGLR
jgi:Tfp pilus assembly protein PilF